MSGVESICSSGTRVNLMDFDDVVRVLAMLVVISLMEDTGCSFTVMLYLSRRVDSHQGMRAAGVDGKQACSMVHELY